VQIDKRQLAEGKKPHSETKDLSDLPCGEAAPRCGDSNRNAEYGNAKRVSPAGNNGPEETHELIGACSGGKFVVSRTGEVCDLRESEVQIGNSG
jgi:hypothetical protein